MTMPAVIAKAAKTIKGRMYETGFYQCETVHFSTPRRTSR
jgi:hypothetical protein